MSKGTVKWFNSHRPQRGDKDVFVSAVERAGLSGLNEGKRLSPAGRQADFQ